MLASAQLTRLSMGVCNRMGRMDRQTKRLFFNLSKAVGKIGLNKNVAVNNTLFDGERRNSPTALLVN